MGFLNIATYCVFYLRVRVFFEFLKKFCVILMMTNSFQWCTNFVNKAVTPTWSFPSVMRSSNTSVLLSGKSKNFQVIHFFIFNLYHLAHQHFPHHKTSTQRVVFFSKILVSLKRLCTNVDFPAIVGPHTNIELPVLNLKSKQTSVSHVHFNNLMLCLYI